MLSKIGGLIAPLFSKGDTVAKPDERSHEKGGGGKKREEESPEENHDGTFFSIDAIRALLVQENAAESGMMEDLDLLQQRGISSIPIREEQPIAEAIREAAARLKA
jgi:hypothetical protein